WLVTTADQVLDPEPGLDLAHVGGRHQPRVDAERLLERNRSLHRLPHPLVHSEEIAGVTEPTRRAAGQLLEALEETEGVADQAARLGRRVVLAHARRALAGRPRGHEALVDDDHIAETSGREMKGGAGPGDTAADDDDLSAERHVWSRACVESG